MKHMIDADDLFVEHGERPVPSLHVVLEDEMLFITQSKENIGITKGQAKELMYMLAVFVEH